MQLAADPAAARPTSVLDASALLALAKRLGVPALTADRTWATAETGEVQLIR